jgi:hypothetical protein
VEVHRYRNLGQGLVPAFGKSAEGWLGEAIRFCEKAIGSHEKNLR